jgi:DNA-binding NtrC family response regulator
MKTILFVDDEEEIVNVTKSMLIALGYNPLVFNNSQQAYTMFEKHADDIDCAVLDLVMPQLDGMTLAGMIKEKRPEIPVIIVTGFRERINMIQAEKVGVHEFLHKPIKRAQLQAAIERSLASHNEPGASASM